MVVEIRSNLSRIGTALRAQILERVEGAVGRSSETVLRVHVGLSDENGPRGGVDKRCRIVAKVAGMDRLVLQDDDSELLPLIDRTTDRFGRLLGRQLEGRSFDSRAKSKPTTGSKPRDLRSQSRT